MLRKGSEFLLGLFYSDEETLVYDNIKVFHSLSSEALQELKSISLKFLGPLFMNSDLYKTKQWKIDYIESSLTPQVGKKCDETLLQSLTCLNSTKKIGEYSTNLFSFIGSPYTEDISLIYGKLDQYIHPSIIQIKLVFQNLYGDDFGFNDIVEKELKRGTDLIEYTLGSPRKVYWEEKIAYSPVAIIKRTKNDEKLNSNLYTFDTDDPLRIEALEYIPSFYFMGILPDYYEKRMNDTLKIFGIEGLYSNIIKIKVSNPNQSVLYIEEYITEGSEKTGYGLVLVPNKADLQESKDLFHFKKQLRLMLDKNKDFESSVIELNPKINPFESWNLNSEHTLQSIEEKLDRR